MCAVEEIRFPAYALALTFVGVAALLGVMAFVGVRNRMLQRRYDLVSGSVKAASNNEVEMQFIGGGSSDADTSHLLGAEDLDRLYKRS
jgi:hypothetical protein